MEIYSGTVDITPSSYNLSIVLMEILKDRPLSILLTGEEGKELLQLQAEYLELKQNELSNSKDQKGEDDQIFPLVRPRIAILSNKYKKYDPIEPFQLTICMKNVIRDHGGACHLETLLDYTQKYWPSATQADGSPLTPAEYKTILLQTLNSSDIFFKDSLGWYLAPEYLAVENVEETTPLSKKVFEILEEEGSSNFDTILQRVKQEWTAPKFSCPVDNDSEKALRDTLSITLETNPLFQYDTKYPYRYFVISKKRPLKKQQGPNSKKRKENDYSSESDQEGPLEPPVGFVCACGAITPGKTQSAKWRIDSKGVFKCISCYGKNKRYNPKPSKKKKRPMQQHTTDDKGPWIQCDRCHTWIPAFSDNIHDITIYEDSNPHHLDYFCPDCRAKPDEPRKSSRVRKRSRALRD